MYLLSRAVRRAGIKPVLTGEGADEFFAGYDIFREAKIREFWSRLPASKLRPKLFDRVYPYAANSPRQAGPLALGFWRQGLERAGEPGFSHDPRWRSTAMLKRFFAPGIREALAFDPAPNVLDSLPPEFPGWDIVEQAQYLEIVTLLRPYLISSQGDRMLMAHGVEGRFPFLDPEVIEFAAALPVLLKLPGLDEKRILKQAGRELLPSPVLERRKQPYRSPDAVCFLGPGAPEYVAEAFSARALERAGIFDAGAVSALLAKCARTGERGRGLGNTDTMALLGILSTQLLYAAFVESGGGVTGPPVKFGTAIDRAPGDAAEGRP
jgi:asparagine synthase (glutamine-hydrolysing)